MRFLKDYGVFSKSLTYEVPREFAQELIRNKLCERVVCVGGEPIPVAVKIMKPSQVTRKGGL